MPEDATTHDTDRTGIESVNPFGFSITRSICVTALQIVYMTQLIPSTSHSEIYPDDAKNCVLQAVLISLIRLLQGPLGGDYITTMAFDD